MAKTTEEKYACSNCHHVHDFKRLAEINVTEEPELREKVLKGEIFHFICPDCQQDNYIEYPLLYIDDAHKFMIWMVLENPIEGDPAKQFFEQLAKYGDPDAINKRRKEYRIRTVSHLNRLIEKILIFENNRDDRILEIMKVLMRGEIGKAKPDMQIRGLYYSPVPGKKTDNFSIETDQGFGQAVEVYEDLYEELGKDVIPVMPEKYKETSVVDEDWAFNLIGYKGFKDMKN